MRRLLLIFWTLPLWATPLQDWRQEHTPFITSGRRPHVVIMVPVHTELANGNLKKLFRSFSRQRAPFESFEMWLLVNNTERAAEKRTAEFLENQKTLTYLKGLKLPFQVRTLDYSTTGTPRNIGAIRNFIAQEAIQHHEERLQNTIFTMFDADTTASPLYVPQIQHAFQIEPKLDWATLDMRLELADDMPIQGALSFAYHQMHYANGSLNAILLDNAIITGPPRYAVRGTMLNYVGGVPTVGYGECRELGTRLTPFKHRRLYFETVLPADRARVAGFNAMMRLDDVSDFHLEDWRKKTNTLFASVRRQMKSVARAIKQNLPPEEWEALENERNAVFAEHNERVQMRRAEIERTSSTPLPKDLQEDDLLQNKRVRREIFGRLTVSNGN